jgi:hypothetical protein
MASNSLSEEFKALFLVFGKKKKGNLHSTKKGFTTTSKNCKKIKQE